MKPIEKYRRERDAAIKRGYTAAKRLKNGAVYMRGVVMKFCKDYRISPQRVYQILARQGVNTRPVPLDGVKISRILAMHNKGKSVADIALAYGVQEDRIAGILTRRGVKLAVNGCNVASR